MNIYWELNHDHETMRNPWLRTLTAMGLMVGPNIDQWVHAHFAAISAGVRAFRRDPTDPNGIDPDSECLWDDFNASFVRQYRDVMERETALGQMLDLHMVGNNLGTYINKFNTLRELAQWRADDAGTLWQFRSGLNKNLHKNIIE
jgi:Retrotransposon gag protein